jgi:DNA-binding beta-propeller fold protein YncE
VDRTGRAALGWVALGLVIACEPAAQAGPVDVVLTLTDIDTLIGLEGGALAKPYELTTDDQGRIYVTDADSSTIKVFSAEGGYLHSIGRRGAGPGELDTPRSVRVRGDTVWVVNGGNGRLELFRTDGPYLASRLLPPGALAAAVDIGVGGALLVTTNGRDSALAVRYDSAGAVVGRVGQPVAPPAEVWDFPAIKQRLASGEVPDALRNSALPVLAADGAVWLFLQTEGVLHRFPENDSREWSLSLDEPEFARIREEVVRLNRADSNPSRFVQPLLAVTAQVVGSDLWLLLRMPEAEGTVFLVVGVDGALRRRVAVPGARAIRGFAVSPDRRRLYLLAYDAAAVLVSRLPVEEAR